MNKVRFLHRIGLRDVRQSGGSLPWPQSGGGVTEIPRRTTDTPAPWGRVVHSRSEGCVLFGLPWTVLHYELKGGTRFELITLLGCRSPSWPLGKFRSCVWLYDNNLLIWRASHNNRRYCSSLQLLMRFSNDWLVSLRTSAFNFFLLDLNVSNVGYLILILILSFLPLCGLMIPKHREVRCVFFPPRKKSMFASFLALAFLVADRGLLHQAPREYHCEYQRSYCNDNYYWNCESPFKTHVVLWGLDWGVYHIYCYIGDSCIKIPWRDCWQRIFDRFSFWLLIVIIYWWNTWPIFISNFYMVCSVWKF